MIERCIDHLAFCNETCPDCGDAVDAYGNTEGQFDYCSFPDCGCDGARLCMAGEASVRALKQNVESMWDRKRIKDPVERRRARHAVANLYGDIIKEEI